MARIRALALVLAVGCGGSKAPSSPPPAQVQLLELRPQDVEQSSEFIASLNSRHAVTLRPLVNATVTKVLVKPGDVVRAGAPIVQLDVSREQALLNNLKAAVAAREANLRLAQDNFNRMSKLAPSGVVSQQELDQAASSLASAKADLVAAQSQVHAQAVQSSYYRVVAPFSGIVGDLLVKVGDVVTPQTLLTQFTEDRTLEAYISVPLSLAPKLDLKTRIQVLGPDNKPVVEAPVSFIAPSVDPATQTVLVKAVFENTQNLRYSQYVRARVVWGQHEALRVPIVAVIRQGGQYFLFVAAPDPKDASKLVAQQRPITVGEAVGNDYVVTDGVKPGDRVIVSGVQFVRNGAPVAAKQDISEREGA